jgi:hypothetical protein
MAESKADILKEGRKLADKAVEAGLSVTALTKVVERLDALQKAREELKLELVKNKADGQLVWKALKAELKGLAGEVKAAKAKAKHVPVAKPEPAAKAVPPAKSVPKKGPAKKLAAPKP